MREHNCEYLFVFFRMSNGMCHCIRMHRVNQSFMQFTTVPISMEHEVGVRNSFISCLKFRMNSINKQNKDSNFDSVKVH